MSVIAFAIQPPVQDSAVDTVLPDVASSLTSAVGHLRIDSWIGHQFAIQYRLVKRDVLVGHRIDRELPLHPLPAGGAEALPSARFVDESRHRARPMRHCLRAPPVARSPRAARPRSCRRPRSRRPAARGRRFQRSDAEPFGQRRVHEQVEAGEEGIEIVPKSRELHDAAETERRRLRAQLVIQIALAEDDEPEPRVPVLELGDGLQQVACPLRGISWPAAAMTKSSSGRREFAPKCLAVVAGHRTRRRRRRRE